MTGRMSKRWNMRIVTPLANIENLLNNHIDMNNYVHPVKRKSGGFQEMLETETERLKMSDLEKRCERAIDKIMAYMDGMGILDNYDCEELMVLIAMLPRYQKERDEAMKGRLN